MKKNIYLLVVLCVSIIMITACGSDDVQDEYNYQTEEDEYEYEDESGNENESENEGESEEQVGSMFTENESPGIYVEPFTGAVISYPSSLIYKADYKGMYGEGLTFGDAEEYPSLQLSIVVDEIYADRIDDAYEKFGFGAGFDEIKLMDYAENYIKVYTISEFFDEKSYTYEWICLLTDGSVLHVTLTSDSNDLTLLSEEIAIDFIDSEGEIGLAAVEVQPFYEGDSSIAGIWHNVDSDVWFECPVANLFCIYKGDGTIIDCGVYDQLFEMLEGQEEEYCVYVGADGLSLNNYEGVFQREEMRDITLVDRIVGIPAEGTLAGESSQEMMAYRGQWENDTISCDLEINRSKMIISEISSQYSCDYEVTNDGNLEFYEDLQVKIQEDGGLIMDGYDGTFYRKGEHDNSYKPYIGQWYNDVNSQGIWLQDGGVYSYENDNGVGGSIWFVTGEGILNIGNDDAYIDENENLVIANHEGVYIRQEEGE